ncbi:MAG: zinc-ribbon domain-containing protein [Clostridia bacterium]|nr:zinc-ribbon domain-containing protein [Clostridia bacterium]
MISCNQCGHQMADEEAKFCSRCGAPMTETISAAPSLFSQRIAKETKPDRKYAIIQETLRENPDDFEANEALLFLGSLHERRRGRTIDFSVIKCNLLCIYDCPETLSSEAYESKHRELYEGEQLNRTRALAKNPAAYYDAYLLRMAREYIDLFIRGDTRYATWGFGFARSIDSLAKSCAEPVKRMIERVRADDRLSDATREQMARALSAGYAGAFPGHSVEA